MKIEYFIEEYKPHCKTPVLIPVIWNIDGLRETDGWFWLNLINLITLAFHFHEKAENGQR